MKKNHRLRKRLIKEGIVLGVMAGAAIAVAVIVSGLSSSSMKKRDSAKSELSQAQSQLQGIATQIDNSKASGSRFEELFKDRASHRFAIERDEATRIIVDLKNRYAMPKLTVTITPEQKLEDPVLSSLSSTVVSSTIKIEFGAISDQHLFAFIQSLQKELPGIVEVRQIMVERRLPMDRVNLAQLSKGATPELVGGTLDLAWFGVEPKIDGAANAAPSP